MTNLLPNRARAGFFRRRAHAYVPAMLALPLAALVLLGGMALATSRTFADGRAPGGDFQNPLVRAVDTAAPAAVRLATLYTAHITLDLAHCGRAVTLPTAGHGYAVGGLGSGAFISSHGDILTADHVVNIDRQELDAEILQTETSASEIAEALNACYTDVGIRLSAADVAGGVLSQLGVPFTTTYSKPQFLVWRDTAWSGKLASGGSGGNDILSGLLSVPHEQASIVVSSVFTQDDLAIVHVGLTDTPSIQLGSSANMAVEDPVTIVGFPGNGDFSSDPTDLLTVSINNGTVSAIKTNDNGSSLIQVGGNIEHGDSGGPALDASGQIVGVVSFGGTETPGITSFLRASDNAQQLISHASLSTAPGKFEKAWEQAFGDYASTASGHWHKAAQELRAISTEYPAFQGITPYLHYAQIQASGESLASGGLASRLPITVIGGAGAIVALALLGILLLVVRSRQRRTKAAAEAQAPALVGAYAAPYGFGYPGAAPYGPPYGPPNGSPTGPAGQSSGGMMAPWSGGAQSPWSSGAPSGPTGPSDPSRPLSSFAGGGRYPGPTSPAAPSQSGPEVCLNGHAMPPNVVSCGICGAPRRARG